MKNNSSPVSFKAIRPPSVVELIIDNFKNALVRGELGPGDRLPSETELAQQLGVGRSAVREAMKVLNALGVVTIRQGAGTFIVEEASPSLLSPLVFAIMLEAGMNSELFELRYLIQVGYIELAAQKATPDDLQLIRAAAERLEEYSRATHPDNDLLTRLDLGFHRAVLDATHNALVQKIGYTVEELFFSSIQTSLLLDVEWALKSHRRIYDALCSADSVQMREAVDFSLRHWKSVVKDRQGTDEA